ncbi:MAG: hypothetical protein WCC01_15205, partial [Acidimicrobiia bacterium]
GGGSAGPDPQRAPRGRVRCPQRYEGHTSVQTVLDVYGHLFEGLDRDIADSLDAPSDAPAAYFLPTSGQNKVIDFPTK